MENDNFECPACCTKHANLADMDEHLLIHLGHYEAPEKSKEVICPKFGSEAEETHLQSCSQCEFKTRLSFALNRHVKIKHAYAGDLAKHRRLEKIEPQQKITDKACHTKMGQQKIKDKVCPSCAFQTVNASILSKHIKLVHCNIKNYNCPLCDYASPDKSSLNLHIKMVHKKIKDYACSLCNFACSGKSQLTMHTKAVHEKIKDKKCPTCNYASSYTSHLAKHIRIAHKICSNPSK